MGVSEVCNLINNVFRRNTIFSLNQIEVHLGTSGWTYINGFATNSPSTNGAYCVCKNWGKHLITWFELFYNAGSSMVSTKIVLPDKKFSGQEDIRDLLRFGNLSCSIRESRTISGCIFNGWPKTFYHQLTIVTRIFLCIKDTLMVQRRPCIAKILARRSLILGVENMEVLISIRHK